MKFNTKENFKKRNKCAYSAMIRLKCIEELCSHMIKGRELNDYWIKDVCFIKSKECSTRTEFQKKFSQGYKKSLKNNWLDEFFPKINN